MSESQRYIINCVLDDEHKTPLSVEIESSILISQLKKEIVKERRHALDHVDPADLTLYQVDIKEPAKTRKGVIESKIRELKEEDALDPLSKLSETYCSAPASDLVHLVVQLLPGGKCFPITP
jgi:hypothetical protein